MERAGVDLSPGGITIAHAALAERGLTFDGRVSDMTVLPWPEHTFGAALSTSTMHHQRRADVRRALGEVKRVLEPGGFFYVDFLSTDSSGYRGRGGNLLDTDTTVRVRLDAEAAQGARWFFTSEGAEGMRPDACPLPSCRVSVSNGTPCDRCAQSRGSVRNASNVRNSLRTVPRHRLPTGLTLLTLTPPPSCTKRNHPHQRTLTLQQPANATGANPRRAKPSRCNRGRCT
jgi:SAM-dependent methyltransferase